MKAVGYCRISTKDQSNYSLDYQQRAIADYCQRHSLQLLSVFTDDGESSYTFDRPDWLALEKFLKSNKEVSHLIIFDHDRFSRNLAEALLKIKELHDKFNIKVLATTDNFDTDYNDPSTFLLRAFKYMMAESELHRIRQRTTKGLTEGKMAGHHTNRAPYGYINTRNAEGKPIITIDEDKAPIIRTIFASYLKGTGIEEIRRMVKPLGFTQSGTSAIQRILENPVYAGMIKVNKQNKIVKGIHTGIVSEQDYWLVQERLHQKNIVIQNNEEVPLRGALRCFCGDLVTAGNSKSKSGKYYWYYLCKKHRNNLPARKLHDQFNQILETLSLKTDAVEKLKNTLTERIEKEVGSRSFELKQLQKSLQVALQKVKATEERYLLHPEISESSYQKVISEQKADVARLQHKIAELSTDQQAYWDRLNDLLPKLSRLRTSYDAMPLYKKHQFINTVFDRQLTHDGNTYRTPYLHNLFSHNELILKEKGLLKIDSPIINLGLTPIRSEIGS